MYASAQPFDFHDLAKKSSFVDWKLEAVVIKQPPLIHEWVTYLLPDTVEGACG